MGDRIDHPDIEKKWFVEIFVRGIGQGRIEEAVIIFRATKGARFVVSSLAGTETNVPVARDH